MIIKCKCGKKFNIEKEHNYGLRCLCDGCRIENKKMYNKQWRSKNKNYNKIYLKQWRKDCKDIENNINKQLEGMKRNDQHNNHNNSTINNTVL